MFSLDSKQKVYQRKVYTYLEMFGDIGGLNDAFFEIFGVIVNLWTYKIFILEFVTGNYLMKKRPKSHLH